MNASASIQHRLKSFVSEWFPNSLQEALPAMSIVLGFGLCLFYANLSLYISGGVTEHEESYAYVTGWLLVPAFSFVGMLVVRRILVHISSLRILGITSLLTGILTTLALREGMLSVPMAVVGTAVVNAVCVIVLKTMKKSEAKPVSGSTPVQSEEAATDNRSGGIATRIVDAGLLALVALAVLCLSYSFTGSDIASFWGPHHHDFYLGPVNDLMAGRSLLWNINCQYGVGVIYALAGVFQTGILPFSYKGFALLLTLLLIAEYIVVYTMMRQWSRSLLLPVMTLIGIVLANYFNQLDLAYMYPSSGPLRFGIPILFLCSEQLRTYNPKRDRLLFIAQCVLIGLASVWNFETMLYTLITVAAVMVCNTGLRYLSGKPVMQDLRRRLLYGVIAIASAHVLLALDVLRRSGHLPNWGYYLDYIKLYSASEFGTLPIEPWSLWWTIPAMYFISVIGVAMQLGRSAKEGVYNERTPVIAGLTAFGIIQFTYFIGRSHTNNLLHICIPAAMLACFWVAQLRHRTVLRTAVVSAYVVVFGVLVYNSMDSLNAKFPNSMLSAFVRFDFNAVATGVTDPWRTEPTEPQVADAIGLMRKYSRGKVFVPVFLDSNMTTEALILTKRNNVFAISNPTQDNLLPAACDRILKAPPALKPGDMVYYDANESGLNDLQLNALATINARYRIEQVEISQNGIVAGRIIGNGE